MRKIKIKPVKRLRFRPSPNTEVVYCYPIEAELFIQKRFEEYEWDCMRERFQALLHGKTIEPEENYFAGAQS